MQKEMKQYKKAYQKRAGTNSSFSGESFLQN